MCKRGCRLIGCLCCARGCLFPLSRWFVLDVFFFFLFLFPSSFFCSFSFFFFFPSRSQPRGSGKRTVVRTVAEKLGVNFVEVFGSVVAGCGGLTSATSSDRRQRVERSPEERIRGIVSRAFEQAPCILYIRHFELACQSSGQTSNEIRGSAAKIADVLSESLMARARQTLGKGGTSDHDSLSQQVRVLCACMLYTTGARCSVFHCKQRESHLCFTLWDSWSAG